MADQDKGDEGAVAKSWSAFAVPGTSDPRAAEKAVKDAGQTEIADRAVAQRIRQAREATGLPQGQLAYRVGISVEQLDRYERGIDRVRVQDLAAISKACGMPLGAFFVEEEQDEFPASADGHSRISDELAMRLRGAARNAAPANGPTGTIQASNTQPSNVAPINSRQAAAPHPGPVQQVPSNQGPVNQGPVNQEPVNQGPTAPQPDYGQGFPAPHATAPAHQPPNTKAPVYHPGVQFPHATEGSSGAARREQLVQEAISAFTRIEDPSLRRGLVELLRALC